MMNLIKQMWNIWIEFDFGLIVQFNGRIISISMVLTLNFSQHFVIQFNMNNVKFVFDCDERWS